jgi:hypothetical protein
MSPVVHGFPSSQEMVLLTCTQPDAGLQLSFVQTLASSQLGAGPPTQTPFKQLSPVEQAFASLHAAVLFAWTQPVAGLQLSVVQALPSSQFGATPPLHVPPPQASPVVHAFPSLHAAVLLA